ncbi:CU044_2847 family protein [Streptomyces sp. NBC_01381]|uniref:CU044_2847 family protein n=1 Tax=Streptomyces sp. NBC_01381 TaxID=2903845 RepID=UPI00225C2DEE|nr:CU044_2847 family protein [Streptomyces sp. NBC_01381]MCX4670760.1 CU044_2847 family protein [Streptomyces sp. NBC_01381]
MPNFTELELADGTAIRFEVFPAQASPPVPGSGADGDLPDGMGHSVPVARGGDAVAAFAVEALRTTLRPLGPLIREVHDAVMESERPPQEANVTFGVQVGQDLKLGIVGGSGQAHLTVSATWQRPSQAG